MKLEELKKENPDFYNVFMNVVNGIKPQEEYEEQMEILDEMKKTKEITSIEELIELENSLNKKESITGVDLAAHIDAKQLKEWVSNQPFEIVYAKEIKPEPQLEIHDVRHIDNWQQIKDATMNTIGKNTGKYPDSVWKKQLLLSEHSPIRLMKFYWRWKNLKSWVSVHFTRHKFGADHFVVTQRSDRTGSNRDEAPQGALVNHAMDANAQSIINVSRKRLCSCASKETREAWRKFKDEVVAPVEPELASVMVPECIYRGFCPEMEQFSCGFDKTPKFERDLMKYRNIHITK